MSVSPGNLAWLNTGDTFGSREIVCVLKLHRGGNAKVRSSDGVREVGITNLERVSDLKLEGVSAKDGLLWRNGKIIELPEADDVALSVGLGCAERLVAILGGKRGLG